MLRTSEDRPLRRDLDDLAEVHHRDAMADVLDHCEVVRDEQIREVELRLQVHQQVDDLRLHRHVQSRHRLVADDQARPYRQRPRDAEALALPAREFVRVLDHLVRAQADALEELGHASAHFRGGQRLVVADRLGHDVGRADARVERRVGVLEYRLELAAHRTHLGPIELIDAPAAPQDVALGRVLQPQDELAGGGFSAAGFADQAQRFAVLDPEAYAVDRVHFGAARE